MKKFWMVIIVAVVVLLGGVWWSNSLSSNDPNLVSSNGVHWHPHLEIYIKGEQQEIPHNIGLTGVHSPMHTHDDTPIVHMEFGGVVMEDDTRLGNFFRIWGKEFNSQQILDYYNGPDGTVYMFVNGEENAEFENYHMQDDDKIEIRYE